MAEWTFLTNHGKALLCIAHNPVARLRDIADDLGITERTAFGIVTDLSAAGYVQKIRDGRRNRYEIKEDLPMKLGIGRDIAVGEVLGLLVGQEDRSL